MSKVPFFGRIAKGFALGMALHIVVVVSSAGEIYVESKVVPPPVAREFRGLWLATVKNIDWPSQPGLPVAQQKAELLTLLDRARQLRLNAVLLQVRPSCDALYASKLEPWSEYLTGRMGQGPSPFYDPLAFAVEEAHARGLELHAWFNPYRARHSAALLSASVDHVSRVRARVTKPYGKSLWLDPGEREVQEHSLSVVMDVVRRYDIDGVHFDDYFYPYPEKDARGRVLSFPDGSSWQRYRDGGGKLGREDWRRENVNLFIVRVSQSIHAAKPWVKFGISPFGIWKQGFPEQIKGLDAYDVLYADARKWLREGWIDYLTPQLYWAEEKRETSFRALLEWWNDENIHHRHLWPGLDASRVGDLRTPEVIVTQVRQSRAQPGADGNILWGARALAENRRGLTELLARQVYDKPAVPPAYPWLGARPVEKPFVSAKADGAGGTRVTCRPTGAEPIRWWILQARLAGTWTMELRAASQSDQVFVLPGRPEIIAAATVDRAGKMSEFVEVERQEEKAGTPR